MEQLESGVIKFGEWNPHSSVYEWIKLNYLKSCTLLEPSLDKSSYLSYVKIVTKLVVSKRLSQSFIFKKNCINHNQN